MSNRGSYIKGIRGGEAMTFDSPGMTRLSELMSRLTIIVGRLTNGPVRHGQIHAVFYTTLGITLSE